MFFRESVMNIEDLYIHPQIQRSVIKIPVNFRCQRDQNEHGEEPRKSRVREGGQHAAHPVRHLKASPREKCGTHARADSRSGRGDSQEMGTSTEECNLR